MNKQTLLTLSAVLILCACATMSLQARAAGQEGMIVVRDAQTGKMRPPTPEEMAALRAAAPPNAAIAANRAARPQAVTRGDGSRGVRIGESNMVYEVVTRGADGKLSSQCVQGEDAAKAALDHPANAAQESDHESR